jgi:hypothetical protein
MRKIGIALVLALAASNAYAQSPLRRSSQVYANLSATGYTIPSGFVGFSAEAGDLIAGFYQGATGANGSWLGVANLLGSNGVLRIGGNSSDQAATAPALTAGIASGLATFVAGLGAGWKLVYGLNLQINNSATAATQAGLIATAMGGGANAVFQFGNEAIGNYVTKSQYETNWNAYYTAVSGTVSGLKVAATDTEDFGDTQAVIAALTPGAAGMTYVTQHWYGSLNGAPYTVASASQMVSTVAINYYLNSGTGNAALPYSGYEINNNWAAANGIKLRLSESNNINNLGLLTYSDRMMSATWYINEAIAFSNMGWDGINTHVAYGNGAGNGIGKYNPIVSKDGGTTYQAAPEFYGQYLFAKIEGQQTVEVSIGGNANLNAIATKGTNGNANILVVNNDPNNVAYVSFGQSLAWTTANVLPLSGTSCSDTAPTLGGSIIGPGGSWSGSSTAVNSVGGIGSTAILPCGIVLIQIQP